MVICDFRRVDEMRALLGQIGCPETSVKIYHYTLRNIPEQRISQSPNC